MFFAIIRAKKPTLAKILKIHCGFYPLTYLYFAVLAI